VVSRQGLPLGYELFAGNRYDSTTMENIVQAMESQYGRAHRIWVMDRGMVGLGLAGLVACKRKSIVGSIHTLL
jgi:transposase